MGIFFFSLFSSLITENKVLPYETWLKAAKSSHAVRDLNIIVV